MNYYNKKVYWNRKCVIHVNLFQNHIGLFSSSLAHHTKAFGTLFSAFFTACHVSHNPFLAFYQGKNETERAICSVLSFHFMLSTKIQNCFRWVAEVSANSSAEHCSLSGLKVQRHYTFILSEIFNSLQLLFAASLVFPTKNTNWDSIP